MGATVFFWTFLHVGKIPTHFHLVFFYLFFLLSLSALVINDTTQVSGKPACLGEGRNFLYRTESL